MYTVDFFIKKFLAIPENLWTVGLYESGGAHCAIGHCNVTYNETYSKEAESLFNIIWDVYKTGVIDINDGRHKQYRQPTPKQRILAALYDIKKMQQPEYKDITKSLAVLPQEETTDIINKSSYKEASCERMSTPVDGAGK